MEHQFILNIQKAKTPSVRGSFSLTYNFLFNLFVDYCNEVFEIEQEDGTIKLVKGVQMIDDIGLLEEIIQWNENLNVDRITSAMGAFGYLHYLRTANLWKPLKYKIQNNEEVEVKAPQPKKLNFFRPPTQNKKTYFRK